MAELRETLLRQLEAEFGHPGDKWEALKKKVQDEAIQRFLDVQAQWLNLIWTLDAYRVSDLCPRDMGNPKTKSESDRLAAVYRGKGNWFGQLIALLLGNQTTHRLAPRTKVQGFSQLHQIDVAWPDRGEEPLEDPLVCLETKVTGAPAYGSRPARGAMSDWSNRRKELKFAATDLKLYRRQQETAIEHWDVWRAGQMPKTYLVWAARIGTRDRIDKMVREVQALVMTYLEGAGIFAWRETDTGHEPVPVPASNRVSSIDDVLYRIATEIKLIAPPGKEPPPPQRPDKKVLDIESLEEDKPTSDD